MVVCWPYVIILLYGSPTLSGTLECTCPLKDQRCFYTRNLMIFMTPQQPLNKKSYVIYGLESFYSTPDLKEEVKIKYYVIMAIRHVRGMYLSLSHP